MGVPTDGPNSVSGSILLVEENETLCQLLRDWVKTAFPDADILHATSEESETVWATVAPDVVLVDIAGASRDCAAKLRRIKEAVPSADVIALVAEDHAARREAVVDAGASICTTFWRINSDVLPTLREKLEAEPDEGAVRVSTYINEDP